MWYTERMPGHLKLYGKLAAWWPLLSAPEEYEEEAGLYRDAILAAAPTRPRTLLELGSGGGNNAFHLKKHFQMTLVDRSPQMLKVSRALNPDCTHLRGDMRSVRLHRLFDAVFIHDAISYMATEEELKAALETAYIHCPAGGVALFCPDWIKERFRPSTEHGGVDRGNRGLRYLEWTIDHDPADRVYTPYITYLLKEGRRVRSGGLDEHVCGLFSEAEWLQLLREAGCRAETRPFEHSGVGQGERCLFRGIKP